MKLNWQVQSLTLASLPISKQSWRLSLSLWEAIMGLKGEKQQTRSKQSLSYDIKTEVTKCFTRRKITREGRDRKTDTTAGATAQ